MDFIRQTPQKRRTGISNRILGSAYKSDSPFRVLPTDYSTPPSRNTKIFNPFEPHLHDRLHLSTCSPSVFSQTPTSMPEKSFKWNIEHISKLKPADIDEDTISQHICEDEHCSDLVVQERINNFFEAKSIVPSPMNDMKALVPAFITDKNLEMDSSIEHYDSSTQTVLSLPPILPQELEEALKPYFTFTADQEALSHKSKSNSLLYRELFDCIEQELEQEMDNDQVDQLLSPTLSIGSSSVHFSPICAKNLEGRTVDSPHEMPELRECNLSPINRSPKNSQSSYKLSFSGHMSIDTSVVSVVPDIMQLPTTDFSPEQDNASCEILANSTIHWDMEFNELSILPSSTSHKGDFNRHTPKSKVFLSQRKRLSDSFKQGDMYSKIDEEMETETLYQSRPSKHRGTIDADSGYQTGGTIICDHSTWNKTSMFASTPTRNETE